MRRDVGVSGDRGGGVIFLHVKCCFVVSVFVSAMFSIFIRGNLNFLVYLVNPQR